MKLILMALLIQSALGAVEITEEQARLEVLLEEVKRLQQLEKLQIEAEIKKHRVGPKKFREYMELLRQTLTKNVAKKQEPLKITADRYRYGIGVEPNQYKAFTLYRDAANKGDPSAMIELSDYYEKGIWVTKDHLKAKQLLEKAIKLGSVAAKWELEFMEKGK